MRKMTHIKLPTLAIIMAVALSSWSGAACAKKKPDKKAAKGAYVEEGQASWYGKKFHGRKTASGEKFNMHALTAAHKTLPFGTRVKVTNLDNSKSVVVKINDRGPFTKGRIIDLSYAAAKKVGMIESGVARVRIKVVKKGKDK